MSGDQENKGRRASEMWVGMRKVCGDISMVVGITVADKTHVFLATREVFGKFADQIAAMPEVGIPSPHGSPRFLCRTERTGDGWRDLPAAVGVSPDGLTLDEPEDVRDAAAYSHPLARAQTFNVGSAEHGWRE